MKMVGTALEEQMVLTASTPHPSMRRRLAVSKSGGRRFAKAIAPFFVVAESNEVKPRWRSSSSSSNLMSG